MKFNMKSFSIAAMITAGILSANAQLFDTSKADNVFNLGVRLGMNMANVSASGPALDWNHDSWGSGFEAGVIADINIREWFSIQPGFFYQSRSNSYTHILGYGPDQNINVGHTLYYAFYVPVMFQARLNVTDRLRWSLEAGPYISFGVGYKDKGITIIPAPQQHFNNGYFDSHKKTVTGLKFGTGLELDRHYYLGIHYMAGFGNAWKENEAITGRNKAWTFTLGYNF